MIGPGLGRDKTRECHLLLQSAMKRSLPLVFDADALFYLNEFHHTIKGYNKAILTPNKVEFGRLFKAVNGNELIGQASASTVKNLAASLGYVTIVKKGRVDIISDGKSIRVCDEPGSGRRCGGQGDVLSGAMGVFSYWAHKYLENDFNDSNGDLGSSSATVLAAMAACMLTRRCNYLAFQKFKRSTLTTDMIGEINEAFSSLFVK